MAKFFNGVVSGVSSVLGYPSNQVPPVPIISGNTTQDPFTNERIVSKSFFRDIDVEQLFTGDNFRNILPEKFAFNPYRANVPSENSDSKALRYFNTKEFTSKANKEFDKLDDKVQFMNLFLVLLSQRHELVGQTQNYPRTYFISLSDKESLPQIKLQIRDYDRILAVKFINKEINLYCFNLSHHGYNGYDKDTKKIILSKATIDLGGKNTNEVWKQIEKYFENYAQYDYSERTIEIDYIYTKSDKSTLPKACAILTELSSNRKLSNSTLTKDKLLDDDIIYISLCLGSICFYEPQDRNQKNEMIKEPFLTPSRLDIIKDILNPPQKS